MLVSDKYKIVFIHIPKSGGSAIRKMIKSVDPNSYTYKKHHAVLGKSDVEYFQDYFKFAVVRNSYKLCASYYRFMTEYIENKKERQEPTGLMEFLKGVTNITDSSSEWQIHECQTPFPVQLDYFCDEGDIMVDKIFYYDKGLDMQLMGLKKKIGYSSPLMQAKGSNYFGKYDWRGYYNRETIEYVRQICKKDIEYFNFKFDEKDNYGA